MYGSIANLLLLLLITSLVYLIKHGLVVASQCLVKPPVKEITRPIDLVLHSDVRAVERAEFDQQVDFYLF